MKLFPDDTNLSRRSVQCVYQHVVEHRHSAMLDRVWYDRNPSRSRHSVESGQQLEFYADVSTFVVVFFGFFAMALVRSTVFVAAGVTVAIIAMLFTGMLICMLALL